MHYLAYFAVVTPLLIAWLFWTAAVVTPPAAPTLFRSLEDGLHQAAATKEPVAGEREPPPARAETTGSAAPNYRAASPPPARGKRATADRPSNNHAPSGRAKQSSIGMSSER